MSEQATAVLLASNILRRPDLFDGLGPPAKKGEGEHREGRRKEGAATGGLCRDLVIFAAINKQRVVEFRLPDFCKEMGYDSSNLMRRCTDEQIDEIRRTGWDEEDIPAFSNVLGLALVRLVRHNFIFSDKGTTSKHKRFSGTKVVENIDVFKPQKSGTLLTFTLSEEVLEHNRKVYQALYKEEYLSLRTQSTTRKLGHPGHPDDAARRMYMRLRWRRGYWDYLIKEGQYEEAKKLEVDSYTELLLVAGLSERGEYWPPKRVAFELRKLLKRIADMASIQLAPTVALKGGKYEVTWKHKPFAPAVAKPTRPSSEVQVSQAAQPTRTKSKPARPVSPATKPVAPAPAAAPARPVAGHAQKLKNERDDLTTSLKFLESDAAKTSKYYLAEPEKLAQAIRDAQARLEAVQNELMAM